MAKSKITAPLRLVKTDVGGLKVHSRRMTRSIEHVDKRIDDIRFVPIEDDEEQELRELLLLIKPER